MKVKIQSRVSDQLFVLFILLIILLCISIISCSSDGDISSDIINDISNCSRKITQITPTNVKIYVDISMSMQGFSIATDEYSNFLTDIESCMFPIDVNFYSISNMIEETSKSALLRENTYVSSESNFGLLSNEEIDTNEVVFFVTDLQFNSEEYYEKFSSNIRRFIYDSYYVNILGTMTDFDGIIFTDMNEECNNFRYEGSRPLYLLVISNVENKDYISKALNKSTLYQRQLPFYCNNDSYIQIPTTTYADNNNNFKLSNGKIIKDIFQLGIKSHRDINPEIKINNSIFNHWNEINDEIFHISGYRINPDNPDTIDIAMDKVDINYSISNVNISDNEIDFNLFIDAFKNPATYIIKIEIIPDEETIPDWILEYSCNRNDGCDTQENHTLLLESLVRRVLIPIKNPNSISTTYIFIDVK